MDMQSMDIWRWHPDMNDGQFGKGNWRKSSQWFALTRHHAELSVTETYIDSIFTKHCYSRWDKLLNRSVAALGNFRSTIRVIADRWDNLLNKSMIAQSELVVLPREPTKRGLAHYRVS